MAWTIGKENTHSASGYTPYEGMQIIGKPIMTYLRGRLVMGDNIYLGRSGYGEFVSQDDVGRGKTIMH